MVDEVMQKYNITNYDYQFWDKTLIIYETLLVETFLKLRKELTDVDNIIIKRKGVKLNI